MGDTVGLLLAAGAGRRMGRPKALVEDRTGLPWVVGAARTLAAGGCVSTVVVIGAEAASVRSLLMAEPVTIVDADDWEGGMGFSLHAGLTALADCPAQAALVHLVDLPDIGAAVVCRMLAHSTPDVLARAAYGTGKGHPVLLGRDHWSAIAAECAGDRGARDYLARHPVLQVDCSDLAKGTDIDDPAAYVSMLDE